MNYKGQHCFLLDGKAIFPIDHNHQIFLPFKVLNSARDRCYLCYQRKYRSHFFDHYCQQSVSKKIKTVTNSKHCQVDEKSFYSQSSQSIRKLSEDKNFDKQISSFMIPTVRPNCCKYHSSDQQANKNKNGVETCKLTRLTYFKNYFLSHQDLITPIRSLMNFSTGFTVMNNDRSHKSTSAITIVIKPFVSSKYNYNYNHNEKETSMDKQFSRNKRKSSSSAIHTTAKRISTSLSDQKLNRTLHKNRLSTFKDITRPKFPTSNAMIFTDNKFPNILNSRTLLNIYRNKKKQIVKK